MTGIAMIRTDLLSYNGGAGRCRYARRAAATSAIRHHHLAATTRAQLDRADNDRNVVMWSWCGQVSGLSAATIQSDYLDNMNQLESTIPASSSCT